MTVSRRGLIGAILAVAVVAVCSVGCGGNKDASLPEKSGRQDAGSKKIDTFTDDRDSMKYGTVRIGNQMWMAENLRYKTGDSWCYGDDESKCQQYGRLYNWKAAKTACPKDWHLPSKDEWTELVTATGSSTGGKKLKSTRGWNGNGGGTDDYGFSALPGGGRTSNGGFSDVGGYGEWWTASEDANGGAYGRGMGYDYDYVGEGGDDKGNGFSVRCVAD
jgi:uncharacterized protein (TIGR02145 family)